MHFMHCVIDDYLRRFCSFRLRRIVTFYLSAPGISTLTHSLTHLTASAMCDYLIIIAQLVCLVFCPISMQKICFKIKWDHMYLISKVLFENCCYYMSTHLKFSLVDVMGVWLCVWAGNVLEVVIGGLEAAAQYQFQVAAYTRKGDGERSRPKKIRTKGAGIGNCWTSTRLLLWCDILSDILQYTVKLCHC